VRNYLLVNYGREAMNAIDSVRFDASEVTGMGGCRP
jgi:hypothetical protein